MTGRVEATLAQYGDVIRSAIAEFLPDGEPAQHLYDLVRDYPGREGKAIRPALLLAACQAVGGTLRAGMGPATALEMLHNAFLVHDDVEDNSPRRRGSATLHELHGIGLAINAGDALACLALAPIRADPVLGPRISMAMLDELRRAVRQTTEGQSIELGWRRENVVDLGPPDYLRMVAKKTCWYTTVAPLRMGALAGSRSEDRYVTLTRFGLYLGAAFQIRDDLLDIEGDPTFGEELGSDLREGKRTLMMIHLLSHACDVDRSWLVQWLADPSAEPGACARVSSLMDHHGSVAFAQEYVVGVTAAALAAFDSAFSGVPSSDHLDFIRDLIPYMGGRHR